MVPAVTSVRKRFLAFSWAPWKCSPMQSQERRSSLHYQGSVLGSLDCQEEGWIHRYATVPSLELASHARSSCRKPQETLASVAVSPSPAMGFRALGTSEKLTHPHFRYGGRKDAALTGRHNWKKAQAYCRLPASGKGPVPGRPGKGVQRRHALSSPAALRFPRTAVTQQAFPLA